jgi:hypothetical protein
MGLLFGRKKSELSKEELDTLHHLLSKLYIGEKFKQTELDDALHLRMRVNHILGDKKR